MDSDDFRFWAAIVSIIVLAVLLVLGSELCWCRHAENMARLGYEEVTLPGKQGTVWHKAVAE